MKVRLLVGTDKGGFLCTSDVARRQWRVDPPLFKGWRVTAAARTPTGKYLAATASSWWGAAMHVSEDFENWRQIARGPSYPEGGKKKLFQIWKIVPNGNRYFAGVDIAGLFYSDDDAGSWHPVSALNDHLTFDAWKPSAAGLCLHSIQIDPRDSRRMWCGISAVGVWRTTDGGQSWQAQNEGIQCVVRDKIYREIGYCVHALALDPENANTIYRQDHSGMFRSVNAGETWQRVQDGLPSWFGFPLAQDRRTRTLFAFPMESDEYRMPVDGEFRVYRSRNRGDSWEKLSNGLPIDRNYGAVLRGGLAVDEMNPCGIYVGSTGGELFWSSDGGDSWDALPVRFPRILSLDVFVED